MAILKNVLGLDLGSHSVKAVEFEQGFRSVEAINLQTVERRDGDQPLTDLLQRLVQVHTLATEHIVTAVRGDRMSVRRLSFPFSQRRRLAPAVILEVQDQLPFDIDEVILDWAVVGQERNKADVVAAVATREEVSQLIASLHEAGCDPRTVEAEGLVLANLTAAFDLPGNRLLADIGHSKTTLCLLADGQPIAARSFGVAGAALTEAIAKDRGFGFEDAERAKCEDGIASAGVGARCGEVLDQIGAEISRMVVSQEPHLIGGLSEVTIFGGTAQLERLDEHLTERTGLPTARLGLPSGEDELHLVAGGSPLVFAPAIALALRGTSRATTDLNFRQDEFAQKVDLRRFRRDFGTTGVLAAIVVALAVTSFATSAMLEAGRAGNVEGKVAALYGDVFPGQSVPDNPVASLREAVRDANERAEFLGVYRGNLSALDLLSKISERIPADLDVTFQELSIDRQTIRIEAYATSFEAAERLGAELGKFGPFGQARIGAIETDKRSGRKKFNVTISLASPEERE